MKKEGRSAKFGIDFLLYLPAAHNASLTADEFVVFYFAATAKREAPEALKRQGKMATFSSKMVGDAKKWFVPVVTDGPETVISPDGLLLQTTLTAFTVDRAPAEPEVEEARPR